MSTLADVYGTLLIVRPPVPATVNKAGANYKSEVAHTDYSPRRAYDEWLSILDAIISCGGDALYAFEPADEPFLDHAALEVDGDGAIHPAGSKETLGSLHRRLRACMFGLHAELPDYGSPLLLDLELFLAVRAGGLPVETPAVRR